MDPHPRKNKRVPPRSHAHRALCLLQQKMHEAEYDSSLPQEAAVCHRGCMRQIMATYLLIWSTMGAACMGIALKRPST